MKRIKSYFVTVFSVVLILVLSACGNTSEGENNGSSSSSQDNDFPNQPINLIVPWSAGGGSDTGARTLQPYLEDELGVSVNIVNRTGGGGWVGWNELSNANPDGYTIGLANSPHIITGYLNPALERDKNLDDFTGLGMHVVDPDTVSIRPDEERFSNLEELVEYAQENEVTIAATGEGTDEHLVALQFNQEYGTNFEPVHYEGASESISNVIGGHVDVLIANLGEVLSNYENGEIDVLGVAAQERSDLLSDVPTLEEQGYEVYQESSRGFLAPDDMDEETAQVLRDAIESAVNNEEHISEMENLGFGVNYETGEDYMSILEEDEENVYELMDLLGWE